MRRRRSPPRRRAWRPTRCWSPPRTRTAGPPSASRENSPATAMAYRKVVVEGIAESIIRAHAALRPAAVGAAAHPLPEEVFNRRWYLKPGKMPLNPFGKLDAVKMNPGTSPEVLDRPAGPTDPDITILSVQDAKRKPLALLANYSLHYVGGMPGGQMSADYFGEFARVMPSRLRADERLRRHDVERHLGRHQQHPVRRHPPAARAVRADPHRRAKGRRHGVARASEDREAPCRCAARHDPARGHAEVSPAHAGAGGRGEGGRSRSRTRRRSKSCRGSRRTTPAMPSARRSVRSRRSP